MEILSDEALTNAYMEALTFNLEDEFLILLQREMNRRGISKYKNIYAEHKTTV